MLGLEGELKYFEVFIYFSASRYVYVASSDWDLVLTRLRCLSCLGIQVWNFSYAHRHFRQMTGTSLSFSELNRRRVELIKCNENTNFALIRPNGLCQRHAIPSSPLTCPHFQIINLASLTHDIILFAPSASRKICSASSQNICNFRKLSVLACSQQIFLKFFL